MAESTFLGELPKARVNIRLGLRTGSAQKKVELPLKLLALGDFSNGKESRPLSEREPVNVNKLNFDNVRSDFKPEFSDAICNTLACDGSEENLHLSFSEMKDFEPEAVAKQIPQFRALMAMRNLLRDLKSNLLDNTEFRKSLESILKAPALSEELRAELNALSPAE